MHCVKADYPTDWPIARVYVLADLHIGDPQCDYAECCKRIEKIKDDPYGLCILNGDLMNTATKTSVSDIYAETLSPMKQIDAIVKLLSTIKGKIIGATTGNHEERVYRLDGIDIMRIACRELGIEPMYSPEGVLVFLRFGKPLAQGKQADSKQWYSIYSTHGCGGGRTIGGKFNKLLGLKSIVDADVYVQSHVHMPVIFPEDFFRVSASQSTVKQVQKLFISTGGAMDYGGYGQRAMYSPSSKSTPIISLDARTKTATATL